MAKPSWLALLAPLPADVVPERRPVATAEQIARGTAGPIAGWQSVAVNLSAEAGSRNILITIDECGRILSAGDHVLCVSQATGDDPSLTIYDHESVGGRYADDGSFQGTRWRIRSEQMADSDDATTTSTPSSPTDDHIAALKRIVDDVMQRPHATRP